MSQSKLEVTFSKAELGTLCLQWVVFEGRGIEARAQEGGGVKLSGIFPLVPACLCGGFRQGRRLDTG